jgi:hypothetical protein
MMSSRIHDRLVLHEFKQLYQSLTSYLPKPLAYLVYGVLVWLEGHYISAKASATVTQAIREFEQQEIPPPSLTEGVYSETGQGFFDEMRITARYRTDESKST